MARIRGATQLYTSTTAENQLAPRQNYVLLGDGTQCKIGLAVNVLTISYVKLTIIWLCFICQEDISALVIYARSQDSYT